MSVTKANKIVSYSYNKDKLDTIATPNNVKYKFAYDAFNRTKSISVGEGAGTQNLINNTYDDISGLLTNSQYGNGNSIGYSYDNLDRVTDKKYNGVSKVNYSYNNDNDIYKKVDQLTSTTTNYTYDLTKRIISSSSSNGHTIKLSVKQ